MPNAYTKSVALAAFGNWRMVALDLKRTGSNLDGRLSASGKLFRGACDDSRARRPKPRPRDMHRRKMRHSEAVAALLRTSFASTNDSTQAFTRG